MFDIGFWELAIIFVVALLVVGPQRLPGLVRSAAYWLGRARQMTSDVKSEIAAELDKAEDLKRLMEEQADIAKRAEEEFKQVLNSDVADADGGKASEQRKPALEPAADLDVVAERSESGALAEEQNPSPSRPRGIPASSSAPRLRPQPEASEPEGAADNKDENKS